MAVVQEAYVEYDQARPPQCGICFQQASRPRALPCLHVFCEGCLRDYAHGKRRLKCPVCRERAKLPAEGVSALPDNNGVVSHTKKLSDFAQITYSEDNVREGNQKCVHHPWEDLRLVCQHCHVPVCLQCLDEMHEGHSAVSFKRVSRRRKTAVRKLVNEGKRTLDVYYTSLQSLQDMQDTLDQSKKHAEENVHSSYDEVLRSLAEERATLLFDIEDSHMRSIAAVQAERENVMARVNDLNGAIDSAEKGMERGVRESDVLLQVLDKCKETPPPPPIQPQLPVFTPQEMSTRILGQLAWQPLTANNNTTDAEKVDRPSVHNVTLHDNDVVLNNRRTPESELLPKTQVQRADYDEVPFEFNHVVEGLQDPRLRPQSSNHSDNQRMDYAVPLEGVSPNLSRHNNGNGPGVVVESPDSGVTKVSHRTGLPDNTPLREPIVSYNSPMQERRQQGHIPTSRQSPFSTDHVDSSVTPADLGVTNYGQARDQSYSLGQGSPRTDRREVVPNTQQGQARLSAPQISPRPSSGSDIPDDGFYLHHPGNVPSPKGGHRISSDSDNVDHGMLGRVADAPGIPHAGQNRMTPTYRETSSEESPHVEYNSGFYRVVRGKKKRSKSSSGSNDTGNDVRYDKREPVSHVPERSHSPFDSSNVNREVVPRQEEQVMQKTPTPSRRHQERTTPDDPLDDAPLRNVVGRQQQIQQVDDMNHDWPEVVPKHIEDEVLKEIARLSNSSREASGHDSSESRDNTESRRQKQGIEVAIEDEGTGLNNSKNRAKLSDGQNLPYKETTATTNTSTGPQEHMSVISADQTMQNLTTEDFAHRDYAKIVTDGDKPEEDPGVTERQDKTHRDKLVGSSSTYSDDYSQLSVSPGPDVFKPEFNGDNRSHPDNILNPEDTKIKPSISDDGDEVLRGSEETPRLIGPNKRGVSFGGEGSKIGNFSGPSGVFVKAEEIYVADQDNNRVQAFNMQGECLGELSTALAPTKGHKSVPMEPHDVAVDANDDIWVVGSDGMASDYILRYDGNGRLLTKIDLPFTGYWRGIAINSRRKFIIVSEPFGGEVKLFAPPRGTLIGTLGGESGLKAPWYVAVDNDGKIYVSDWSGHYIYVFQENGKMLFKFGGEGSGDGELQCPCGICVDNAGNIIVADSLNQRVEMFDKKGTFIRHIATDLNGPQAVAMAGDGTIVVTETDSNTVSIFYY